MKITNIKKTCEACPTQFEGTLENGHMFYVRYRWGCLSISISPEPTEDVFDAVDGEERLDIQLGDGLDGYTDDNVIFKHLLLLGWEITDETVVS